MENYVIIDTSDNLGGAETLTYKIMKYIINKTNDNLILISPKDAMSKKLLDQDGLNYNFYELPEYNKSVKYLFSSEKKSLKNLGNKIKRDFGDEYIVICPYFQRLQLAMLIFANLKARLFTGFFHAEAWARSLYRSTNARSFMLKKNKNKLYYYMQNILGDLDKNNALWFLNNEYRLYNEYYFEMDFKNSNIIPIPIDIDNYDEHDFKNIKDSSLKLLWLGRFEYFKNPSIKNIINNLNELYDKYNLNIEFGLIGYGKDKYEDDIKSFIENYNNKINFKLHGKVIPNNLTKIFSEYNIGVAMGTSAFHFAEYKMPTIIIDSAGEEYIDNIKGIWLHKSPVGYIGNGQYMEHINRSIEGRKEIKFLLEEIIEDENKLIDYGERCFDFIYENYRSDKVVKEILSKSKNSKYMANENIFELNVLFKTLRHLYEYIR